MVFKKQNKNIIIVILIVGVMLLVATQTQFLSFIFGSNKMACSDAGTNKWSCSMTGGAIVTGAGGKISIVMTEPLGDLSRSMRFDKANYVSYSFKNFLNTHRVATWDVRQFYSYDLYEPYDPENDWQTKLPGIVMHQYFDNFAWNLRYEVVDNLLGDQLIIMKGTAREKYTGEDLGGFETYGLCNGRYCWVYDPHPSREFAELTHLFTTVYFREGGYVEEDACSDFDVGCPECLNGEVQTYACWDGTMVPHCDCINGQWACVLSPESQCPGKECVIASDCEGKPHIAVLGAWKCINNECIWEEEAIPIPPVPPKPLWTRIIDFIIEWINKIFDFFFVVAGPTEVEVGSTQTYNIDLSTAPPDSDYSDGTYSIQHGSWALVDKNGNIKQEGAWEEVQGNYKKSVTITVPSNPGDYAVIGVIYQTDMQYNPTIKQWETINENVVIKEGLNVATKAPAPPEIKPIWQSIIGLLKSIWDWLIGWFK